MHVMNDDWNVLLYSINKNHVVEGGLLIQLQISI